MLTRIGKSIARSFATPASLNPVLSPAVFYNQLTSRGFDYFVGVPDSLLMDFCGYVSDVHPKDKHFVTANEGNAVGMAIGYNISTGKYPLVYLQNSGLGNIVNPYISIADPVVYRTPMLFLIGWRGERGTGDEPQHNTQGDIMNNIIADLGINFEVLPTNEKNSAEAIDAALYQMNTRGKSHALIVRKGTWEKYNFHSAIKSNYPLSREQAINIVISKMQKKDAIIATTGFPSRELYQVRVDNGQALDQDLYCIGGMGHASSVALGIALAKKDRDVYCLDGDGGFLMHMGAAAIIGTSGVTNFKHIIMNNSAHDSVGGQPTVGFSVDFAGVAKACGYKYCATVSTAEEISRALDEIKEVKGPALVDIRVIRNTRKGLGHPQGETLDNKNRFIKFLNS